MPALPPWMVELTEQPGTTAAPTGLAWAPATNLRATGDRRYTNLVAWRGGFAMLEEAVGPTGTVRLVGIWRSADGKTWRRAAAPERFWEPAAFLAYRDGLVLGSVRPRERTDSFTLHLWRSRDGAAWREVGKVTGLLPAVLAEPWRITPMDLFAVGDRLVQLAQVAWTVGASVDGIDRPVRSPAPGGKVDGSKPALMLGWVSRGGAAWERRPVRAGVGDGADLDLFTDGAGGVLARRVFDALLVSPDGLTWAELAPLPPDAALGANAGLVLADGRPLLLSDMAGPGSGDPLGAWLLGDDATWTQVLATGPTFAIDQAAAGQVVIISGTGWDSGGRRWPWILVSSDGGSTWDRDQSWAGPDGGCVGDVAIANRRVALLGCARGGPAVWVAPLPDAEVGTASPAPLTPAPTTNPA